MKDFGIFCVGDILTFDSNPKQIFTTVEKEKIRKLNHTQIFKLYHFRAVCKRPTSSLVLGQLKLISTYIANNEIAFLKELLPTLTYQFLKYREQHNTKLSEEIL